MTPTAVRHRRAKIVVLIVVVLGVVLGSISAAYAAGLFFDVGTLKQNPLTTVKAPVQLRDQFGGSGALNGRSLEIHDGAGWSTTNAPAWSQAANWQIDSGAAQRSGGSGASFARVPWLDRGTTTTAEFSTMPTSNNLQNVKYGVGILGSASTVDALVAVVFRNGNGSNGRFYLEIGTVAAGTYTTRVSPVQVTATQSQVPTNTTLRIDYNAADRRATASFNGAQLQYTIPMSPPFAMGTHAGLFAQGQNNNYRLDNFGAQYPAAPPVDPCEITVTPHITNDWSTGFNAEVQVTTDCVTPISWEVDVDLSTFPLNAESVGSISNGTLVNWNPTTRILRVKGAGWNDLVSNSTPRTFSFNATRPPAPPQEASYQAVVDNDWGAGYCATVTVSTTSPTPITWEVHVNLSTAPLNGVPYTVWEANYSFAGQTLTATGASHNKEVSAGNPKTFGFCANR